MRSSDWSSDVCSSDLSASSIAVLEAAIVFSLYRQEENRVTGEWFQPLTCACHRAKMAVGSSRPRLSSRIAMSPISTVPPRSAVAKSEEHTSELQSLMRISSAVFCLKKKKNKQHKY